MNAFDTTLTVDNSHTIGADNISAHFMFKKMLVNKVPSGFAQHIIDTKQFLSSFSLWKILRVIKGILKYALMQLFVYFEEMVYARCRIDS